MKPRHVRRSRNAITETNAQATLKELPLDGLWQMKVHLTLPEPIDGCAGESMWAIGMDDAAELFRTDAVGVRCYVWLDNNSLFYKELIVGSWITIEFRGAALPEIVRSDDWTMML